MMLNSRALIWTVIAFLIAGVVVILVRNSTWAIERRSLRELRFMEIDGFVAPLLLFAIIPSVRLFGILVERLDFCERAYGELFGMVLPLSFSIGFAISGLRQKNTIGRIIAGLTLFVIFLSPLLFPAVSS
jgi:hypothetical protein